jgi:hypothetical protein
MRVFRRWFASCALLLACCQVAVLVAAPMSSCCPTRAAASAESEVDCCPPGSHAPGQCPLHRRAAARDDASCRLTCDASHGAQFVLGAVGVLPTPAVAAVSLVPSHRLTFAAAVPAFHRPIPDSPPPRLR